MAVVKFNLVHVKLGPRDHGLNGYLEVIDTVEWGLTQLGHTVTRSINKPDGSARNICFGTQVYSPEQYMELPADTIIYNFEQWRGWETKEMPAAIHHAALNLEVWDYSEFNRDAWQSLNPERHVKIVPVGYAPILERIPQTSEANKDIDAIIYGLPNGYRLSAFNLLCRKGITAVFVCGLYGEARDALISRSRVVVNLSLYPKSHIFEVVRVSYLLANRKSVAAFVTPETGIEADLVGTFAPGAADTLVDVVVDLVDQPDKRRQLEETAYVTFKKRDIRHILEQALG
jgi:hypothetical protein